MGRRQCSANQSKLMEITPYIDVRSTAADPFKGIMDDLMFDSLISPAANLRTSNTIDARWVGGNFSGKYLNLIFEPVEDLQLITWSWLVDF